MIRMDLFDQIMGDALNQFKVLMGRCSKTTTVSPEGLSVVVTAAVAAAAASVCERAREFTCVFAATLNTATTAVIIFRWRHARACGIRLHCGAVAAPAAVLVRGFSELAQTHVISGRECTVRQQQQHF